MKSPRKLLSALMITGTLLLALGSCKKDAYEIGFDLLPPSDTLHVQTTDTCTVYAFSMIQDSVRTSEPSTLVLGSILDPVFGKTTCSFYSQVQLSTEGVDFGTAPVLDSLVLKLYYSTCTGDTTTRQNVKVYELSQDIYYDSNYYSNQSVGCYPTLLADQYFTPHPKDSVTIDGKKEQAHLRINLSNQTHYLGNKILYAPSAALASNDEFIKFFKGLYVTANPVTSNGALLRFITNNGLSKLVVYYHNGNDPEEDSLKFEMPVNESCARFVQINHHGYLHASQDFKRQVLNHDSAQGANKLFLQGMGGVKIKVKFPYMDQFAKGKVVAINDALLMIKNFETDTTFAPPPTITMIRQDSIGRMGYVVDDTEGTEYFGGYYDQTKRTYFFRITQHMQKIMEHYYSNHFDLYILVNYPLSSVINPGRVVFTGTRPTLPGTEEDRFRLKVTYTVLN